MVFANINKLKWKHNLRLKLMYLVIFLIFIIGFLRFNKIDASMKECYIGYSSQKNESLKLEDILLNSKKPVPGKSIFFHETSCSKLGNLKINARQACAIESAALANPNTEVFILFASPTYYDSQLPIVNALLTYPNVNFRNVNIWTYAADTPIYEWLKDGQLFQSKYVLSHTSDFLRYLTLWRWGGTYLDLDVIVQKSLENIPSNYAGAESDHAVAAGILNFDADGFGHQIADMCLNNFQIHFDGNDWGNNGPGVITRVLQKICKTKSPLLMMNRERCLGFQVYQPNAFYAVRWKDWNMFFDSNKVNNTLNATKDSFIIHVWNMHSAKSSIKVGSKKVAYGILAEKYCPKVYSSCGEYF